MANPPTTKDLLCRLTEMSSAIPSAAPQNMVIVTIIKAEPINECPTCGQPGVLRDHVILAYFDHYILWCVIHAANIRHKINAP
ncbi:hypothetical protein ACDL62_08715 [Corynebacterium diphtheriae]|uniref:hypothetical protein n=1 Tax=Corynebacterium diphtheriae TaxID=1717 RepID=UPI001F51E647|nr:hypothetical protein [Corynebacterium diphtheriae]